MLGMYRLFICILVLLVMRAEIWIFTFIILTSGLVKANVFRDPGIYLKLDYSNMLVDQHGPKVFTNEDKNFSKMPNGNFRQTQISNHFEIFYLPYSRNY